MKKTKQEIMAGMPNPHVTPKRQHNIVQAIDIIGTQLVSAQGRLMTAHTPTPWSKLTSGLDDDQLIATIHPDWIIYGDGRGQSATPVAIIPMVDGKILQSEFNADHIVACVNAHDKLVAALRAFVERGAKVSGFEQAYSPWIGELVNARALLSEIDKG